MRSGSILIKVAFIAVAMAICASAQKPVIDSRGVMNAATLVPAGWPTPGGAVAAGSIATIFGQNLAPATAVAAQVPLPTSLAGVSVLWHPTTNGPIGDTPLPLFYVSPGQINFQIPSSAAGLSWPILVQTPNGSSEPVFPYFDGSAPGVFVQDGSGCGPAWIFNVAPDGTWSLNSPDNSVEPGGIIVVLGTGMGLVWGVVDGQPAPSNPPPRQSVGGQIAFEVPTDGAPVGGSIPYANRAPGMVGVDQYNFRLPDNVIEGCGIPLKVTSPGYIPIAWDSQPVPVNVHRGGGKCGSLPAPQSYAGMTLQKTTTVNPDSTPTTSEQLNVSLSSAVGKRLPDPAPGAPVDSCTCLPSYPDGWITGPSCPFPAFLDKPLDVGFIGVTGAGFNVQYPAKGTDTIFQVPLPAGALVPGPVTISASGGPGAGPFSVPVPVMNEIQFDNPAPKGVVDYYNDFVFKWTGAEPDEVVRIRLTSADHFCECAKNATAGTMIIWATAQCMGLYCLPLPMTNNAAVTVTLESSPQSVPFTAPGLTLGGTAGWTRIWRYTNLKFY